MKRIGRRRFLQVSGTGALAAILAGGRAPAFAQGTTLHWLRWSDYVPASDKLLREQIAPECEKALGLKLAIEFVNANDIQARITSAVSSGAGPDIVMVVNNWPQLYAKSVADVSDVAEAIGKEEGGYYDVSRAVATQDGKWLGVPWSLGGGLLTNRKSWFAEIGITEQNFPKTWEEYHAAGKKLKAAGRPFGQTLGHTFGDAPLFWYPYLWSWGGKEVESDGKTVALNNKATLDSVKYAIDLWKDCYDPGGLAWDDSSNNRAFLSGTVSSTNNGASIYLEAKKKPETYLTEKGAPLWKDIFHTRLPGGPGGQYTLPGPFTDLVMEYSKNQDAARKFLRWVHSKPIFEQWFASQQGYTDGPTKYWADNPVWQKDPVVLPFRDLPLAGRLPGYAGPPDRAAAEVQTKYIIIDMYAKAVQGSLSPEDAVKWAEGELKGIYA
ncbi:MAG TPA: extracellular solute-binding protein [Stellaceae bacterium]|nr:extracellular solute-binding protein [Stellaceae bacterium]